MSDGGKGSDRRPTDHKKWSNNYDNIKWTKEEDETRLQDRLGSQRPMANGDSAETLPKT